MKDKTIKHRRFINDVKVVKRADGEDQEVRQIEGIASKVGVEYNMGGYIERIAPGAFDAVLRDDVRVLKNHDANLILGRTKSGTAELFLTSEGHLGYRSDIPDRSYARDLVDELATGDIDGSSFAFYVKEDAWLKEERDGKEVHIWEIRKMGKLFDVGPATYPASPTTESSVRQLWAQRSAELEQEEQSLEDIEKRRTAESGKREARLREADLLIKKGLLQ